MHPRSSRKRKLKSARRFNSSTSKYSLLAIVALTAIVLSVVAVLGAKTQVEARPTLPLPASTSGQVNDPAAEESKPAIRLEKSGEPFEVLVLGDSLAASYFASTIDNGFKPILFSALGNVVEHEAVVAHQTTSYIDRIAEIPAGLDLVIVELGTNDRGAGTELSTFRSSYAGLLERTRAASPETQLMCLGTWTDTGSEYDKIIRDECAARAGVYVSLADLFDVPEYHGPEGIVVAQGISDEFHPNDAGHRAIADAVLSQIEIID